MTWAPGTFAFPPAQGDLGQPPAQPRRFPTTCNSHGTVEKLKSRAWWCILLLQQREGEGRPAQPSPEHGNKRKIPRRGLCILLVTSRARGPREWPCACGRARGPPGTARSEPRWALRPTWPRLPPAEHAEEKIRAPADRAGCRAGRPARDAAARTGQELASMAWDWEGVKPEPTRWHSPPAMHDGWIAFLCGGWSAQQWWLVSWSLPCMHVRSDRSLHAVIADAVAN